MLSIEFSMIGGVAVGVEYVSPEQTGETRHNLVVDLLIVRFLISWNAKQ